jgi:hypothetical protein
MTPAEARFRKVEAVLNKKLEDYRHDKISTGVVFRDLSAPAYHYKNQFLSWRWTFVRDTQLDGETKRLSVSIGYCEPLDGKDKVEIAVRAEVFQPGQVSRIDRKDERSLAVEQLESDSFVTFIENGFARGQTLLAEKLTASPAINDAVQTAISHDNTIVEVTTGWEKVNEVVSMRKPLSPSVRRALNGDRRLRNWSSEDTPHNRAEEGYTDDQAKVAISFPKASQA